MKQVSASKHRRPIAIDFFSGAGGMSLGFEQAGFDIALSVDRDGHHVAAHHRNFPYGKSLCASVSSLSAKTLRDAANIDGEIDLVFGGPPCQGFSHMGLRDPGDSRNTLVDEFCRLVGELNPRAFVMENVVGMQSGDTQEIFQRAIRTFQRLGYEITSPVRTLNALHFGVPQGRERLFVLGKRSDIKGTLRYPEGPEPGQPRRPTVWEAISDLPEVDSYESTFKSDELAYDRVPEPGNLYALVARGLKQDPSDHSRPRAWNKATCTGAYRVRHGEAARALYAATQPGEMVPGHKLPRLDPQGYAPTLRAGSESEHGSHTAPRPVHPKSPRCITIREAARLHGYPDWFRFYPARWHAYRQIGNSVCPPVARAVGNQVMYVLGRTPCVDSQQPIVLSNEFPLPENRLKHETRISHMDEFPKVVEALFSRAFDTKKKSLVRSIIRASDVEQAIRSSHANIPRTRPERFIEELARSRNLARLLSPALERGFSILPVVEQDAIGRFVPKGTSGALGEHDAISIRSKDVNNALPLEVPADTSLSTSDTIVSLLSSKKVLFTLFANNTPQLSVERNLFGNTTGSVIRSQLNNEHRTSEPACILLLKKGRYLTKTYLANVASEHQVQVLLIATPLTLEHLFTAVYRLRKKRLSEVNRCVFRLVRSGSPHAPPLTRTQTNARTVK